MTFDNIQNYYETMVIKEINELLIRKEIDTDEDFLNDLACVALNQLPARYVRHNVDMIFYMTQEERQEMHDNVSEAVQTAISYVSKHRHDNRPETISQ